VTRGYEKLVLQKILGEGIRQLPRIRYEADRLFATATGTAIGIGAAPGVKQFYREWISKQDWKNPYKSRRGKGEIVVELMPGL